MTQAFVVACATEDGKTFVVQFRIKIPHDSFMRGSLIQAYRDNEPVIIKEMWINGTQFTG